MWIFHNQKLRMRYSHLHHIIRNRQTTNVYLILLKKISRLFIFGYKLNAKKICGNKVVFIDPSLDALDDLLQTESLDYVGTRLHCGIRSLQHKRRSLIIAVDNRATEMGKDFNLPVVQRNDVAITLDKKINSVWRTDIQIDQDAINTWKNQFSEDFQKRDVSLPELSGLRSLYQKVIPLRVRQSIRKTVRKSLF